VLVVKEDKVSAWFAVALCAALCLPPDNMRASGRRIWEDRDVFLTRPPRFSRSLQRSR
jgi:hypothetical protein